MLDGAVPTTSRARHHVRARTIIAAATLVLAAACAGGSSPADEPFGPETLAIFDGAAPGDIVGLAVDDQRRIVSWLHRTDGTIHELTADESGGPGTIVATVEVGTESQQGGLLDQTFLPDGTRVLTWTTTDEELVVGTLADDESEPTIHWSAGRAGNGAIGGKLDLADDGTLLLGLGRNTRWQQALDVGGPDLDGAVIRFGLDGSERDGAFADPTVISTGYTNPWAFEDVGGAIWVWDNAAGPDPDDPAVDDIERIGRADLEPDRNRMERSEVAGRAPAAMIELPDGRLGVCGFLDNEMRAYEAVFDTRLERAGTIMPCDVSAAVFGDGTIVAIALGDGGESLQILRP